MLEFMFDPDCWFILWPASIVLGIDISLAVKVMVS